MRVLLPRIIVFVFISRPTIHASMIYGCVYFVDNGRYIDLVGLFLPYDVFANLFFVVHLDASVEKRIELNNKIL